MGIRFRPEKRNVISSTACMFDKTTIHVFERYVFKILSSVVGIRSDLFKPSFKTKKAGMGQ